MSDGRIMVVEDERIVAKDLQRSLEDLGYEVCALVSAGEQAVHTAAKTMPDLIMMDINLDGEMDGLEAAEIIRKDHDIPCVFLTAYSDDTTLQRAKASEPSGFLVKPFDRRELRATIEMALNKREVELALKESSNRVTQALEKALENSSRNDQMKLQLLAAVSHEMQTPVTAIKLFVSTFLADETQLDESEKRGFVEEIGKASDRMTELIAGLLKRAQYRSGDLPVSPVPDGFRPGVDAALDDLKLAAPERRIDVEIADHLPPVTADPVRIREAVGNLLFNAAKHTPLDTGIRLECRSDLEESETVLLSVHDDGPGIPAADLDRIFDPFQRPAADNGSQGPGSGLGLAISKQIVEAHGGRIWAESLPGGGATFNVRLPAEAVQSSPIQAPLQMTEFTSD